MVQRLLGRSDFWGGLLDAAEILQFGAGLGEWHP